MLRSVDTPDSQDLRRELRKTLGTEHYKSDIELIVKRIRGEQREPWDWEGLDDVVVEMRRLHSGEVESWQAKDRRFESFLKRVTPESVDRLALYLPEDTVKVQFRGKHHQRMESARPGFSRTANRRAPVFRPRLWRRADPFGSTGGRFGQHPDLRVVGQQNTGDQAQAAGDRCHSPIPTSWSTATPNWCSLSNPPRARVASPARVACRKGRFGTKSVA